MKDAPGSLVEHFFRHEAANLIAVLSRAFGLRRMDLVEDMVQAAMLEAMHAWRQKGIPVNPAAWIHRVARNKILDALRREEVHQRAMALAGQTAAASEALVDGWLEADQLPDSLLRMIFTCCHPALDRSSQVALTLKVLCGFSINEIARGLIMKPDSVKKRIQRAKRRLVELNVAIEFPADEQQQQRLTSVHEVLYLMFNEGYSASSGRDPIRDDVCEEAARLCHLLCEHRIGTSGTFALMALMLFHAARLDSRVDDDGAAVLLEDQDRNRWDRGLIRVAKYWLSRAQAGPLTRYHMEAGIAMQHCHAESLAATNWRAIIACYDQLMQTQPSPVYVLNRAIARAQTGEVEAALRELNSICDHPGMQDYFLLDCAIAKLHELRGRPDLAIERYQIALSRSVAEHETTLLRKKIARLAAC